METAAAPEDLQATETVALHVNAYYQMDQLRLLRLELFGQSTTITQECEVFELKARCHTAAYKCRVS